MRHLKISNKKSILFATLVIVLNLLIGHFFAPNGIILTPITLIISTAIIVFYSEHLRPKNLILIILGLIILHDVGMKLYSGGIHDRQGYGLLHFFLFIGLVPTYIMTIVGIFNNRQAQLPEKIISLLIFPLIITGYIYLFSDLGLGRQY